VSLVQFSGDWEGASECHRTVTLDRQWNSLEEIRSLMRISRDVGQSATQFGKECDAGCVDGTEGLQSQRLKNVGAWDRWVFCRLSGHSMLCCTAWTGGDWDIGRGQSTILTTVTSHASDLPASRGISVLPSGRLPSSLTDPDGSLIAGMLALNTARQTRLLTWWWRAILQKANSASYPQQDWKWVVTYWLPNS